MRLLVEGNCKVVACHGLKLFCSRFIWSDFMVLLKSCFVKSTT